MTLLLLLQLEVDILDTVSLFSLLLRLHILKANVGLVYFTLSFALIRSALHGLHECFDGSDVSH